MRYFVSYATPTTRGHGNAVLSLPSPIRGQEDINAVQDHIAARVGGPVVVLHFTPLDDTRADLAGILADLRAFHASDDGTDKHPDHQYLTEDIERRIAALLANAEGGRA